MRGGGGGGANGRGGGGGGGGLGPDTADAVQVAAGCDVSAEATLASTAAAARWTGAAKVVPGACATTVVRDLRADTAEVVSNTGTAEVVQDGDTVEVVPAADTAEAVPGYFDSDFAEDELPLAGFVQPSPPFYFGGRVPAPIASGAKGVLSVPLPTTGPCCGLPFRKGPDVEGSRARWLAQIARLRTLPGANQSELDEVQTAIENGARQEFAAGPPSPALYDNTYSFKQNEGVCLERLKVYGEMGAVRKLAEREGGYSFVHPLHAVVKTGKKARVCLDLSRNFND